MGGVRRAWMIAGLCAAALSGCNQTGGAGRTVSPAPVPASQSAIVEVKDDPLETVVRFNGPKTLHGFQPDGFPVNTASLRSWVDRATGVAAHQLYVVDIYDGPGWKFWNRARGEDGENLQFTSIGRETIACGRYSGCTYHEIFGVLMFDHILKQKAKSGYDVQFYSQSGEVKFVHVNADMITRQIEAIEQRFPPKPAAAAAERSGVKKPARKTS